MNVSKNRIEKVLEMTISPSQYAYRANRSAGDVVLAHKYLIAGAYSKGQNTTCIGIDMSKAFDTVIRPKLIDILAARGVQPGDIGLIKLLLTNTSLQVKCGINVGEKFATNKVSRKVMDCPPNFLPCTLKWRSEKSKKE